MMTKEVLEKNCQQSVLKLCLPSPPLSDSGHSHCQSSQPLAALFPSYLNLLGCVFEFEIWRCKYCCGTLSEAEQAARGSEGEPEVELVETFAPVSANIVGWYIATIAILSDDVNTTIKTIDWGANIYISTVMLYFGQWVVFALPRPENPFLNGFFFRIFIASCSQLFFASTLIWAGEALVDNGDSGRLISSNNGFNNVCNDLTMTCLATISAESVLLCKGMPRQDYQYWRSVQFSWTVCESTAMIGHIEPL